ncbi:type II secretion system F family protein [Embleya sp. NBC_00896]|uniref:type II secretion system F family protein n=1 Tax=Embleya sp. NBC_00896 TaxID=2975961 RepID=UPI003866E337|nr:type II secretion system F family protein [Embleya sp. NBC_00896]
MSEALLVAVCGCMLVGGLVLFVVGVVGTYDDPTPRPAGRLQLAIQRMRSKPATARQRAVRRIKLTVGVVVAALVWLFSGFLMAGVLVLVAFAGMSWLLAPTKSDRTLINRLDALAEWTRRIADLIELGAGLENAIVTSRATCPPVIEEQVGDLVSRLQSRWRPDEALRAFAADLGDATADKIAAALILRSEARGPGLALALKDLATTVREEVRQRRAIEADRAGARMAVRWITYITLGMIALVVVINRDYAQPYHSAIGQLVLLLMACAYVGTLLWMRSLAADRVNPRFLVADPRSVVKAAQAVDEQIATQDPNAPRPVVLRREWT